MTTGAKFEKQQGFVALGGAVNVLSKEINNIRAFEHSQYFDFLVCNLITLLASNRATFKDKIASGVKVGHKIHKAKAAFGQSLLDMHCV